MNRHNTYIKVIRSTVLIFAIGLGVASFVLDNEPPTSSENGGRPLNHNQA